MNFKELSDRDFLALSHQEKLNHIRENDERLVALNKNISATVIQEKGSEGIIIDRLPDSFPSVISQNDVNELKAREKYRGHLESLMKKI